METKAPTVTGLLTRDASGAQSNGVLVEQVPVCQKLLDMETHQCRRMQGRLEPSAKEPFCSKGHDIGSCLLPPGTKLCKAREAVFGGSKRVSTTLTSLMDLSLTYVDSKIYQLWLVLDRASNSRLLFCISAQWSGPCLTVQRCGSSLEPPMIS